MFCCKQGAAGIPQFCCQRRRLWILREVDWDANLCTCNRVMCNFPVVSRCVRRHKVSKLGLETCTCVRVSGNLRACLCAVLQQLQLVILRSCLVLQVSDGQYAATAMRSTCDYRSNRHFLHRVLPASSGSFVASSVLVERAESQATTWNFLRRARGCRC